MISKDPTAPGLAGDCWNRIGVAGDGSCGQLDAVVHCRNCDVFVAAGRAFLDRPQPEGYAAEWHAALSDARETEVDASETMTAIFFRVRGEWFALEAGCCREVIEVRPVHGLPHRGDDVFLGLINVRGEQQLCVSLSGFLGPEERERGESISHIAYPRMLVMEMHGHAWTTPVDEVYGLQTFRRRDLHDPPATVSRTAATFTRGLLDWKDTRVGLLDADHLFNALRRHVL